MNFQDYIRYDAVGLAELIRKKEVSADEVLRAALSRLDEVNPKSQSVGARFARTRGGVAGVV